MAEIRNDNLVNTLLRVNFWPVRGGIRPPFLQQMSRSQSHIRDDLHHVLRGLRPLMERPSNLSSVSSWIRQQQQHRSNPSASSSTPDHVMPPHQVEDITIQVDESRHAESSSVDGSIQTITTTTGGNERLVSSSSTGGNRGNVPPPPPAGAPPTPSSETADNAARNPDLQSFLTVVERYAPFILILLLKLLFDYRISLLIIAGLLIAFYHANLVVKREVGKQAKRQVSCLFLVVLNVLSCIIFVYFFLAEKYLAYALVFIPPYDEPLSAWGVIWIVTVTDFILKLITVAVKALIVALPAHVLPFQNRGKYYYFLESLSQLYRSLCPVRHWLYYFTSSYTGLSYAFGIFLSLFYFIYKCQELLKRFKDVEKGFKKLLQDVSYGSKPTTEQLKDSGDTCPICQDDFKTPTILQCKHIFCEECVSIWFDRERTCPMCRAEIADNPIWRDGSTSHLVQIF